MSSSPESYIMTFVTVQDLPGPDQLLTDVVQNIKAGGICKHFVELFDAGKGSKMFT